MQIRRWIYGVIGLGVLLAIAAAVGFYGRWGRKAPEGPPASPGLHVGHGTGPTASGERKILYWYDPMHPWIRSDKPGKAPDCGMDLVPKYADEASPEEAPGAVYISPARQQLIGVRTGSVVRRPVQKVLRTVGIVAVDETLIHHIHTRISGWVRHVYINFTGQFIQKGETVLDIYSPDVLATEQEYVLALRLRDSLQDAAPEARRQAEQAVRDALQRLRLWDIPPDEIDRLERTRQPAEVVHIRTDMTGYVMDLNVRHGMYVTPEMEIYKIADLRRVWVQIVVYEPDLEFVQVGQPVRVTARSYPDRVWTGVVDYVYPDVDPQTRTVKVRLSLPNPGYILKPGMYVDAELQRDLGEQIVVPVEAVIDTGVRQYAFVVRGEGYFEPREIRTGGRVEEGYIVLQGLHEGEMVVTSANFLIDSESQFRLALEAMTAPGHAHAAPPTPSAPGGPIEIRVTEKGFQPATVRIPVGRSVTLRFLRVAENACATAVRIPDLKIERELPLNRPVDIPLSVDRPATLQFTCGMNMVTGTIVVEEEP